MQNTPNFPTHKRSTLSWPLLLGFNAVLAYLVLTEQVPALVLGPMALLVFFLLLISSPGGRGVMLVVLTHYTPWALSAILPALQGELQPLETTWVASGVLLEHLLLALVMVQVKSRLAPGWLPVGLVLGETLLTLPALGAYRSPFSMGFLVLDTGLGNLYSMLGAPTPLLFMGWLAVLLWQSRTLLALLLAGTTSLLALQLSPQGQDLNLKVQVIEPRQPDYTGNMLYRPVQQARHLDDLRAHLNTIPADHLVVIPEFGVPLNYYPGGDNSRLQKLFAGRTVLFGTAEAQPLDLYNAAILHQNGTFEVVYRKRTLVPRVEDTWLSPGDRAGILTWQGKRFGILICLEAIYPNEARDYQKMGVDGLIVLTNTQARESLKHQMKAIRARAKETGLPILVASYTGNSATLTPKHP